MSDCGGILVACLAAPLLLIVLLVAGVTYLALEGARLVGHLALEGIQFAGSALGSGVRAASEAIATAGTYLVDASGQAAAWASGLLDSAQVGNRVRSAAQAAYTAAVGAGVTAAQDFLPAAPIGVPTTSHNRYRVDPRVASPVGPGAIALATAGGVVSASNAVSAGPAGEFAVVHAEARVHAQDLLARAQAAHAALESELPLRLVAENRFAEQLATSRSLESSAAACLAAGDAVRAADLASRSADLVAATIHQSHNRLVIAERATVAATVGNSLQDLGYSVKAASVKGNVALVGRREHHTIAMVVGAGGQLQMDMAGFSGDTCSAETRALLEQLRKNGLTISAEQIHRHGRFEGGAMIRAARERGKSLELALAELMSEDNLPAADTDVREADPVRRRTRLAEASPEEARRRANAWLWAQTNTSKEGAQ